MADGLNFSCRIRRTPFTERVEAEGVRGYSVVNHMLLPKSFRHSAEEDYWHLRHNVQIWDVSCQRQLEVRGPDASRLVQLMVPRDISKMEAGTCIYSPVIDKYAGILNDPVLMRHAEDCYWLSLSDSDLLFYAIGLATALQLDVGISEPDIGTLAIQGPHAEKLLVDLFGSGIAGMDRFAWGRFDLFGISMPISRTGYSSQDGFEIYLEESHHGPRLWDAVSEAGARYNLRPGYPNLADRIEAGLMSYGNELTRQVNPIEAGLERFCDFEGGHEYFGRGALHGIHEAGTTRIMRGFMFGTRPCPVCAMPWSLMLDGSRVGAITSASWSPRLECNVGLGLVLRAASESTSLVVATPDGCSGVATCPNPINRHGQSRDAV